MKLFLKEFIIKHFTVLAILSMILCAYMFSDRLLTSIHDGISDRSVFNHKISELTAKHDSLSLINDSLSVTLLDLNDEYDSIVNRIDVMSAEYDDLLNNITSTHTKIDSNDVFQDFDNIKNFLSAYHIN